MAYDLIIYETQDQIAKLTMNRPEKLNALSVPLREEIIAAVREAEADPAIRVIVLKGAGRAFSSGYDITPSSAGGGAHQYGQHLRADIEHLKQIPKRWDEIWYLSKPVIAQVHGYCLAGGTDLAQSCDFIVAAEDALFGYPPVRSMGAPPCHMWTYNVGPQWAKYLLMTGNSIDGKTAERIGLAWRAVPADQLEDAVQELAGTLAKVTWDLLAAGKSIVNKALDLMGRNTLQTLAAETDAIGHHAQVALEFYRMREEQGLQAALEWRDAPFRDQRR